MSSEYAQALFEEAGEDFKRAREACIKRGYDNMMLGAARPLKAIEAVFDTAIELMRLADKRDAAVKAEECALEFRTRYGELFAK